MDSYRYSKGLFYKITSPNTDKVYVGCTTRSLNDRLNEHHRAFRFHNRHPTLNYGYCSSYKVIEHGNATITLIDELTNITSRELFDKERELIRSIPCVNAREVIVLSDEEIKHRRRQYYEANKEKINQYSKNYYEANKEKMKQYGKNIYATKYKQQTICECGGKYTLLNKKRHSKTKKHMNYITAL